MKKPFIQNLYFFLFFLSACYPNSQPDQKPEQMDLPEMRKETGGTPDYTTTQGTGIFYSPLKECKEGFGLCDIDLAQPSNDQNQKQGNEVQNQKRQKATFYLGTNKDSIRIEFSEEIPQFESNFEVAFSDTLFNCFGHEYVVLQKGTYPAIKGHSHYGEVSIPISLGPRKEEFAQPAKKE